MILLQFILVHYGFMLIAEKYELQKLMRGVKFTKLFYIIAECRLCYTHTVGIALLIFLILTNGFTFVYLLYPLMSTGVLFLLTKERL